MVVRSSIMNNNEIAVHQLLGLTNKILLNKSLLFSVAYYCKILSVRTVYREYVVCLFISVACFCGFCLITCYVFNRGDSLPCSDGDAVVGDFLPDF